MVKQEKERGWMDVIKEVLSYVSQIVSAPIVESTEVIIKKVSSLFIIGVGGIFLVFSLLFFLKEYFLWSTATAFFAIGITIFVIGLLMKDRQ